jgi:FMN phosphatase YigB (HAD superfamily)
MQLTVRAHELATLLDRAPAGITTLSLDCFDTLMWRNVAAPRDVFAEIPLPGGGIEPRVWAEGVSQRMAHARTGSREVGLDTIYRRMLTDADEAGVAAGVAHELACEARHLFPFAPVVELMRDAKRRGLSIIIVSDMYLSEAQLRTLLLQTAGEEIVGMIDHIFMSSEHGMPKSQGLFIPVLQAIGARPAEVLHVGDNRHADYEGAARCGIHAVHFDQFTDETRQRLRLEAAAGIMLDPTTRVTVPAYQQHRPQVSLRQDDEIAAVVGHDVMGPVMHAFATWLKDELDTLSEKLGKPVRPLFLMRDGYLPFRAFDALYPEAGARRIEISRLSAARASFHDEAALDEFITEYIDVLPAKALTKQLLLFEPEVAKALKSSRQGRDQQAALNKALKSPELRRKIVGRSKKFAERLIAHLRLNDVASGDAVMLVDIGYKGTVQNIITPVLTRGIGLQVSGRYLFLREECISGLDKAGLLGTDLFECRALHALGTCVAVVEQMCNIAAGSTVDYKSNGEPIREESGVKSQQNAARDAVQAACLDYVRAGTSAMHRRPASDTIEARRRMAGAILTRLLFMPLESEVRLFERFDHDVNLGTKAMMKLLDHDGAAEGLRRRGIAYVNETRRMYVPGEILKHGLPLNLSLLATSRFGLDMRDSDFLVGGIDVPVIVIDASEQDVLQLKAYPTHDGYYRLSVPVGLRRPTVAIQLGQLCELVQIDDLSWTPISQYNASWTAKTAPAAMVPDGIAETEDGLHRCALTGVLIVPPGIAKEPQVLTLVFRPIRWRDAGGVATRQEAA